MSESLHDRFAGSMLALAMGDALGAPFEGGLIERVAWQVIGLAQPGMLRYTDDTEMALGCARSLVERGGLDVEHMVQTWAAGMTAGRGYGPGARRVLRMIHHGQPWQEASRKVWPEGSFGNGAAMRVAPLGLFFHRDRVRLDEAVRQASEVTHAHRLGIEGAVLVARAVAMALEDVPPRELLQHVDDEGFSQAYHSRLERARDMLAASPGPWPEEVARTLGHDITALESTVTAIYVACRFLSEPFESLMSFVVSLGGDVDTIAAMAGGIWGARRGEGPLPRRHLDRLENREQIETLARRLAEVGG